MDIVMKSGARTIAKKSASLRIRRCTALPEHMRKDTREVLELTTVPEKRGQGYATSLMHALCREADAANITLVLFVKPFDDEPLSARELRTWYSKTFGFTVLQEDPVLMARMPGSTPKLLKLHPLQEALYKEQIK